jgi:hypothetical protein
MKLKIKKIFRYPFVDIYMLFAYCIAFVALFFAISVFDEIFNYKNDAQQYNYDSTYEAELSGISDFEKFLSLSFDDCNVKLSQYNVALDTAELSISTLVDIYLQTNDEYLTPLISGQYPDGSIKEEVCIIGKNISEELNVALGEDMLINNEKYRVIGIAGTNDSDAFSGEIILWYNNITEELKKSIINTGCWSILFESNSKNTRDIYLETYDKLKSIDSDVSFMSISSSTSERFGTKYIHIILYLLIYIFALIHCIVASDIWEKKREYEVALKQMLGYSKGRIARDLFLQILKLVIIAAVLCFIVQFAFNSFGKSIFGIRLEISAINLGIIFFFIIITGVVSVLYPVLHLNKKSVVDALKEGTVL